MTKAGGAGMNLETPETVAYVDGFEEGAALIKRRFEPLLTAARDLHAFHAAQRQVSRAAGESLACPCPICVAVERMEGR